MANSLQARKRARQTQSRTAHNKTLRSQMRTDVKKLEKAIENGDKETIGTQFPVAMSSLHKGVNKGLLKKETAARRITRLSSRVKSLSA